MNLADLLPASSIWTGEEKAPCPFYRPGAPALAHCVTTGATPFRLNLHVRDVGNAIMLGPTGAGDVNTEDSRFPRFNEDPLLEINGA